MRAAVITAVCFLAQPAHAGTALQTTEQLYTYCLDAQRVLRGADQGEWSIEASMNAGNCIGALLAMNGMVNRLSANDILPTKACSHMQSVMQIVAVYVDWVERNPKHMMRLSSDTFTAAMIEAFPCTEHPWPK